MPARALAAVEARSKLADVIGDLEEDIIFGRLKPRERLIEEALAQRFDVNRHIVRDALGELERRGIVSKERHKGSVVRDFAVRDVEHIYEVRELLQARAARDIPLPAAALLVKRLESVHHAHLKAIKAGQLRQVFHLNNEFHETLFSACGNPYLVRTIDEYAWLAHAIRSYRIADAVLLAQAADEHAKMIAALIDGDRVALVRLCVDHIKPAKEAYLRTHGLTFKSERGKSNRA